MLSIEIVKSMCAQWNLLFEHDGPTCLRIRPIVSSRHPLKTSDDHEPIIRAERAELGRLLDDPDSFVPHEIPQFEDLATARPGRAAFFGAARILANGYHETFVARMRLMRLLANNGREWAFEDPDIAVADHFSEDRTRFEPRSPEMVEYRCIFGSPKPIILTTARALELGIAQLNLSSLPGEIQDRILEVAESYTLVEHWMELPNFVSVDVKETDANSAVDLAIYQIERFRMEAAVGVVCSIDPYQDLHKQAIIIREDRVIMFDWKSNRRSARKLSTKTDKKVVWRAVGRADNTSKILEKFSQARSMLDQSSDREIFINLIEVQDVVFGDYIKCLGPSRARRSKYFIDLSARWIAMNATREVMASALNEEWSRIRQVVDKYKTLRGDKLLAAASTEIPSDSPYASGEPRFTRERVLHRIDYIRRAEASVGAWKHHFVRNYTRTLLDFNHIRLARNRLVHQAEFIGSSYYTTLLLELLRGTLSFRIACEGALYEAPERARLRVSDFARRAGISPESASFVLGMHGIVMDSCWSLGAGRSFWLSGEKLRKMHTYGWGGWTGGGFVRTLESLADTSVDLATFNLTPATLFDLRNIEIL